MRKLSSAKKTNLNHIVIESLGWYGMFAILLAYTLINIKILTLDSLLYTLLNLTGALGLLIVAKHNRSWQFVALNTVWLIVAIKALI